MPSVENTVGRLERLGGAGLFSALADKRIGLEKEALRVDRNALLARTPHPTALGAALTHPHITTDYSEALLELITPPLSSGAAAIAFLEDIHGYIHRRLDDEILWANSMPCVTKGDDSIPLAQYGGSNIGRMKTIYRRGLGHRYGRSMQTIAGVHFNYSFSPELWDCLREAGVWSDGGHRSKQAFRSHGYMALIRNLLRVSWALPYLFGASPAVCAAFVSSPASLSGRLEELDEGTLFSPHATALRMGDIGYQNNQESEAGFIDVSCDNLDQYVADLKRVVTTPLDRYRRFGVKVEGEFRQLNDHVLQIENEYYSTIRPKRVTSRRGEMPLLALYRGGVEYVELRSLDVGAFDPAGVSAVQIDFMEALFLYCLLADSPPLDANARRESKQNEIRAAHEGRRDGLELVCEGRARKLSDWGIDLCSRMAAACGLLDRAHDTDRYRRALDEHRQRFEDSGTTPSARLIRALRESGESFVAYTFRKSQETGEHFRSRPLDKARERYFDELTEKSRREQADIEAGDTASLDEYIAAYFAQLSEIAEREKA